MNTIPVVATSIIMVTFAIRVILLQIQGLRAYWWNRVQGTIDTFEVIDRGGGAHAYEVRAGYHFEYLGQHHRGERFSYRSATGTWEACLDLADRYPEGRPVEVYVNATDPRESVLVPGVDVLVCLMALVILVLAIVLPVSLVEV